MGQKYYRVRSPLYDSLDTSLYIEKLTDKLGRTYYIQVEDYSIVNTKVYRSRIRKSVAENGIKEGRWRRK